MKNIVLNIPHSSINGIFDETIGKWKNNPFFINECVNKWTDWYTDLIFNCDDVNLTKIVFPYSRFVCDVERLVDDEMEKIGQGIIYTHFNGYERKPLNEKEIGCLYKLWQTHQNNIIKCLTSDSILIDCHSFPSYLSESDICIGYNNDWSYNEKLINIIRHTFEENGYSVSLNMPFANSITPKTDFNYKSVMIEVNKSVYMNESTLKLNTNPRQWMRWFGTIKKIYENVSKI